MFKVGDRVRVVSADGVALPCLGREATVIAVNCDIWPYRIMVDGVPSKAANGAWSADPHELAPLTPPAEDTWVADAVRKVTKPLHTGPVKVTA